MEAETTMYGVSEAELIDAGASDLFVSYYNTAPESASARHEVDTGRFELSELAEKPQLGGGFFEALWNGDERTAVRRADGANRGILRETPGVRVAEHVF
jgi:hypothetical protein